MDLRPGDTLFPDRYPEASQAIGVVVAVRSDSCDHVQVLWVLAVDSNNDASSYHGKIKWYNVNDFRYWHVERP